jgi:3-oxoacyl-[acyl-carrier protein] reductase
MDLQLEGKRALVTGSSSGIGEAIALRLAAEGCSAVIVHGRDADRTNDVAAAVRAAGATAEVVLSPLTSVAGARELADVVLAGGPLDILVNNAGGRNTSEPESWDDIDPQAWAETFQLNVFSPAILASRALEGMRERNWGRIIQISSVGSHVPRPDTSDYGASKAALNHTTTSMALAVAGTGITVNTISPGAIGTPALRRGINRMAEARGWTGSPDEIEQQAVANYFPSTAGRLGLPYEVGVAAAFLVSPLASFINGINLHVDGGRARL